jgi:hypothetical protein
MLPGRHTPSTTINTTATTVAAINAMLKYSSTRGARSPGAVVGSAAAAKIARFDIRSIRSTVTRPPAGESGHCRRKIKG